MKRVAACLVAAALLALPVAASAHRQWLLPSATIFSGTDSWVTVDAAASNDLFFADHQPMRLDGLKAWAPDGSEARIENASTGRYRSTFDVKLDKSGTWKIGTQSTNVTGSFKLNGEERRVGGRPTMTPPAGAPGSPPRPAAVSVADIPPEAADVKLTEVSSRNEIFVTADAPSTTVFKPTGKGLELEPITHPDELVTGEPASFRFLVDGKPAAGLKVTVVPGGKRYRNDDGARELTTGADGLVRIDWPAPGMYWINATTTDEKASEPRAAQRRLNYMTTVEVLLP
ncbi:DUF4198 domain-containing protein [Rhizorhabdus argentea]|uniref:DUF4198 domain-containing protein n=1 Tax=Rhizorhabdus argentea TaxID=1387174 RepID=UPI0030EF6C94